MSEEYRPSEAESEAAQREALIACAAEVRLAQALFRKAEGEGAPRPNAAVMPFFMKAVDAIRRVEKKHEELLAQANGKDGAYLYVPALEITATVVAASITLRDEFEPDSHPIISVDGLWIVAFVQYLRVSELFAALQGAFCDVDNGSEPFAFGSEMADGLRALLVDEEERTLFPPSEDLT